MCFSFEVSLVTFIIGTLGIIRAQKMYGNNKIVTAMNIGWALPIIMQFWESLIWKKVNCPFSTKMAFLTNIFQPLIYLISFWYYGIIMDMNPIYLIIICLVYLYLMKDLFKMDYGCALEDCGVNLKWWNSSSYACIYFIYMLSISNFIVNEKVRVFNCVYFVFSALASNIVSSMFCKRPTNGNIGSIWCLFASCAPYLYPVLLEL